MKHYFSIIFCIFFLLILSSCNNNTSQIKEISPLLNFSSIAKIKTNNFSIDAKIIKNDSGLIYIEVISPENLKGLVIKHDLTETSISKKDLSYKTNSIIFPNTSIFTSLIDVLSYMEKNKENLQPFYKSNKDIVFTGNLENGKFELHSEKTTGIITEIKIGEKTNIQFQKL